MKRKILQLFCLRGIARKQFPHYCGIRGAFLFFLFMAGFSFFSPNESYGQNPLVKQGDYRFGGSDFDELHSLQQTADGGYILGGDSYSGISGDKTQASQGGADYWMVKTDSDGLKQWDAQFGGSDYEKLNSLQETTDGGYILGGYSWSGISGDKTQASQGNADYWIVKTDSLGNKQWDKDFGGTGYDWLYSLQQTADGGYILGGWSSSGISGDKTQASQGSYDYWIVKTDSGGMKQWDARFGGYNYDQFYSLQQTADGGYILGGYSYSGISGDKTQDNWGPSYTSDYWIVKTDAGGVKQWDARFGGNNDDHLYSLQQTADAGYILGGLSYSGISGDKTQASWGSYDYWIVKTDSLGNKQWDKDFGGTGDEDVFGNITQTADGGYLLAGTSYSPISGDKTENNLGMEQTWLVKTDSSGNKQWDKTIFTTGHDEIGLVIQTSDGCYVMANYTNAGIGGDKTQSSWGGYDYWIIKFCDTTGFFLMPPTSLISSNISIICQSSCISFTDQSTNNPTSWQWLFPGASPSISSLQNPANICYNTSGMYDVTLIASNANGSDTLTLANYITVYAAPAPPVITQSNDTLMSTSAYSYQWFMNGSVIPAATNQQLIITQSGDYSVMITDSFGCSASDTIAAVLLLPQSAFSSNAISGCPNSCFDFTNASVNATSYQWFFAGGLPDSSSQQNPSSICYATPGVYDVMLIASSLFASDTLVQTGYITIFTPLAISISQNGNFLTCNPAASSYQWLLNGNQIPGATSQTLFISQTGTYIIDVTDSNGCFSADTLFVNSIPSPNFSVNDTSLCEKFCISFFDQSTNNPTAWQWNFPGGDPSGSTDQNPVSICYAIPGVYDVTLITTNAYGNDTTTLSNYITVFTTPPFPTITQNGYVLTSSAAVSYQWQLNALDITGATNQSYSVLQTGLYTVIAGDSNGCVNSVTQYVLISAVGEVDDDSDIFISPNPSNGNFNIEWLNDLTVGAFSIAVINTLGQIIFSSSEKDTSPFKKEIYLGTASSGVYFIEIKTGKDFVMKKIIVEK